MDVCDLKVPRHPGRTFLFKKLSEVPLLSMDTKGGLWDEFRPFL